MTETNEILKNKCGTRIIRNGKSLIYPLSCRKEFDESIIYSENKNSAIKGKLQWNPMSEEWKKWCEKEFWFQDTLPEMKKLHRRMNDKMFDLKEKLLEFAGESACLPAYEEDLDNILKYGQFWIGNNIKMIKGFPSQCHYNSCLCWEANKDKTRICTGYALSDDGMWRQHSWLIWMKPRSNQIVETTTKRIAYFGFVMTKEQCEKFEEDNF